jgi:ABC-type uncharacterized transport system involved in gliding motility auxiliary subunit
MKKKLLSGSSIAMACVILLTINILAGVSLKSMRLDLTDNQLYTLAEGSRNVISSLEEPVTLRFYYSEKLAVGVPGLNSYAQRVRELLEEYAGISEGKVKLVITDPEPFSEEEDQAVQFGLQGVPVDNAGSQVYFGLVGSSATGDQEIIPFFQTNKEASLEYDITRLIYKLGKPERPVLGILTTLPMQGGVQNPLDQSSGNQDWMIIGQLQQLFDVRFLDKDVSEIETDIDVLMLVHPNGLSDSTLFAIDQYVLRGGRIFAFIDPYAEMDQLAFGSKSPMAGIQLSRGSELGKLLDAWGVELVAGKLVGEKESAMRVSIRNGSRTLPVDYVLWMQLDRSHMNGDDFVTAGLQQINLGTAGYLRSKAEAGTKMTPLLETGSKAATFDSSRVQIGLSPVALLDQYKPGGEKLTLAARISGSVKSAFPDGDPEGSNSEALKESKGPVNLIVVADTDLLADKFWVQVQNFFNRRIAIPFSGNGSFVINAVENLSGSNDLISLRSRGNSIRPFDKVKEIQRDAEQQFRDKERELQARLQESQRRITKLQQQKSDESTVILSQEQQREIKKIRNDVVKTRKELRNVQHELKKNIEQLGDTLKFINIALIPLFITVLAIVIGIQRQRRANRLAVQ